MPMILIANRCKDYDLRKGRCRKKTIVKMLISVQTSSTEHLPK